MAHGSATALVLLATLGPSSASATALAAVAIGHRRLQSVADTNCIAPPSTTLTNLWTQTVRNGDYWDVISPAQMAAVGLTSTGVGIDEV